LPRRASPPRPSATRRGKPVKSRIAPDRPFAGRRRRLSGSKPACS
jgi:hypothetical protein